MMQPRSNNIVSTSFLVGVLSITTMMNSCCHAFVHPISLSVSHGPQAIKSQLFALTTIPLFDESMTIAEVDSDISDAAFTDSINYFDGTIGTMGIAFIIVIAILAGFKALTGQMDQAIEKVLVDFETVMKRYYPQQWQEIENELEGMTADERSVKLFETMEQMQETQPEMMAKVREKM